MGCIEGWPLLLVSPACALESDEGLYPEIGAGPAQPVSSNNKSRNPRQLRAASCRHIGLRGRSLPWWQAGLPQTVFPQWGG